MSGANCEGSPRIERGGVTLFGGFEGASLAAIRAVADGFFEIDCLEEPHVPELAFNKVFYDYNFACGIRSQLPDAHEVRIRLRLCPRSARRNANFLCGPYWIRRGEQWIRLSEAAHVSGDGWVDTSLTLRPSDEIVLSTKPYWTSAETGEQLARYRDLLPFCHTRSIGRTAQGRDIWCIETEPRDRVCIVSSSLQSAEFAGDVCLHVLDWLGTDTLPIGKWLERYQFCLVPETMPDSVANGLSIVNTQGRCPMFDAARAFAGESPCAEETSSLVGLVLEKRPDLWIDLHVHPGRYNSAKLNPVKPEGYPSAETAARATRVEAALSGLFCGERNISLPVDDPKFSMRDSAPVLAAEQFGTVSLCFQNYARTDAGTQAFMVTFMETVLGAMEETP